MAGIAKFFCWAYLKRLRTSSPTITPVLRVSTSLAPMFVISVRCMIEWLGLNAAGVFAKNGRNAVEEQGSNYVGMMNGGGSVLQVKLCPELPLTSTNQSRRSTSLRRKPASLSSASPCDVKLVGKDARGLYLWTCTTLAVSVLSK